MDTSPRASAAGYLRVSDADRDSALAELSEHFQAGRLTAAELDERTGQALSARTGEDLAGLMADLPPLAVAEVTDAAGPRRAGHRALAAWAAVAVAATGSVVAVLAVRGPGHGALFPQRLRCFRGSALCGISQALPRKHAHMCRTHYEDADGLARGPVRTGCAGASA